MELNESVLNKIDALIEEAVHKGNILLDKRNTGSSPIARDVKKQRKELAGAIRKERQFRDGQRKAGQNSAANYSDNTARTLSQAEVTGSNLKNSQSSNPNYQSKEGDKEGGSDKMFNKPRVVASAKK